MILIIKWSFPSYTLWFGGFPSIKLYVEKSMRLSNPCLVAFYNYCLHVSMQQRVSQSSYCTAGKEMLLSFLPVLSVTILDG